VRAGAFAGFVSSKGHNHRACVYRRVSPVYHCGHLKVDQGQQAGCEVTRELGGRHERPQGEESGSSE
jgi:hypothetical protein